MSKDFENKVALVTGGAGAGIGSHAVRRIAREGGSVAVVDIHEKRCRLVAEEIARETGARVLLWAGSCFGACDIPLELERLGVGLLVQFGHSEWRVK